MKLRRVTGVGIGGATGPRATQSFGHRGQGPPPLNFGVIVLKTVEETCQHSNTHSKLLVGVKI